jgi:cytoskeletal protein CcmA (bactofilin family)
MNNAAQIGPTIRIKGEVISGEPLTIAGHVDGKIDAAGHPVNVVAGSHIKATISAETIVVGGAVKGKLHAATRIVVQQSASIDGELIAPAVSLAEGATIQGRIESAGRKKAALSLAS